MVNKNTITETRTTQRTQSLIELKEAEERSEYASKQADSFRYSYELRERADRLKDEKPTKAIGLEQEAKKHDAQIAKWRGEELKRRSYDHRVVKEARLEKESAKEKNSPDKDIDFER